ncbi:MAG TPA: F0F1 ATP synthase subunit delta [Chthoniobacterales bacterium]|nr:F0F1 ATP synthase subunit delta [Chthoniobacterales bacterium]
MKINREIRRISREMLRASFTDKQLDQGKVAALVQSLVEKKPRHYIPILENYQRLIRLEMEKRHAKIESAGELSPEVRSQITASLQRKYGSDLSTEFAVTPELLGGLRIRVGSDVWDGSVRNRLLRLERDLAA